MIEAVDDLLADRSVIVVVGQGGVGKTTVAAAIGVRAAQAHGRRVLVVTVDPARRLADALGVNGLPGEAVLVPVGEGNGRLWVLMVEMSRAWDDLVRQTAPDPMTAEELLGNGLYRSLTTRFVASHDYVALDHLCLLEDHGPYDLIVVDTPPGEHAADMFAAPGRLRQFFDSRLLRWLTAGVGGGLTRVASRPFLRVAERLLGRDFLGQIGEFFTIFARLRVGLVGRIDRVEAVLASREAALIEVRAADRVTSSHPVSRQVDVLLVNRVLPTTRATVSAVGGRRRLELSSPLGPDDFEPIKDRSLRRAVESLAACTADMIEELPPGVHVALLPRQFGGVNDLADLVALTDEAHLEPWHR